MPGRETLLLARFSAAEARAEVNVTLRSYTLPFLEGCPEVGDAFVACRAGDRDWEYVVAATVTDPERAPQLCDEISACLLDRSPVQVTPLVRATSPLRFGLRFPAPEPGRVLRLFDGEVRDGMLDEYVEAARVGTIEDAMGGRGPCVLLLASDGSARFTTVSVWSDWERIEAATGGDVDHPVKSKRHAGLIGGTVRHFELVADPITRPLEVESAS